jgi:hypothetical protein
MFGTQALSGIKMSMSEAPWMSVENQVYHMLVWSPNKVLYTYLFGRPTKYLAHIFVWLPNKVL